MATSVIPTIKVTTNPTSNENVAAGYPLGQHWFNSSTGVEFIHKTDGVWINVTDSITKVDTLTIKSKQLTGFESPELVNVSYDSTNRTITLTGKTIRITGCPCVAGCDTSIATGKGWTVNSAT